MARHPHPFQRHVVRRATRVLLAVCATLGASQAHSGGAVGAPYETSHATLPSRNVSDAAALLHAPPGAAIPSSPLDERLARDAGDGALDEFSLSAAALVASGVHDPQVLARHERRIDAWGDELAHSRAVTGAPRARARAIFDFLHRRILTGDYDANCTELDRTLDEGSFNCVSSLVLYWRLCRRFAVPVVAVETPGHSFAVLVASDAPWDVETTCPDWFELSDAGRRRRQSPASTGGRPEGDHGGEPPRRELSETALVAIVYYNRAIDLLHRDAFARAVAANQLALRLDPASADARENLLATLNNWALDLCERGEREQALAVLRHGLAAAPDHARLRRNYVAILQRQAHEPARAAYTTSRGGHAGSP